LQNKDRIRYKKEITQLKLKNNTKSNLIKNNENVESDDINDKCSSETEDDKNNYTKEYLD
jgi:hypothetical protein